MIEYLLGIIASLIIIPLTGLVVGYSVGGVINGIGWIINELTDYKYSNGTGRKY